MPTIPLTPEEIAEVEIAVAIATEYYREYKEKANDKDIEFVFRYWR